MSKTIVTKLVSPPRSKRVLVNCANCYAPFYLRVPVKQTEGEVECDVCEAKTSWQEVDELTTFEKDAIRGQR